MLPYSFPERESCHPYFTDEESEVQRGESPGPRPHSCGGRALRAVAPGSLGQAMAEGVTRCWVVFNQFLHSTQNQHRAQELELPLGDAGAWAGGAGAVEGEWGGRSADLGLQALHEVPTSSPAGGKA